jgi:hypothetical protein
MGGMVWSTKESWYGLVTLIEVGYDPPTDVYMLGLTRIRLVVAEIWAVLANERTQIWSDLVPGLSVDTLGAFRVEIAVTRSESGLDWSR